MSYYERKTRRAEEMVGLMWPAALFFLVLIIALS